MIFADKLIALRKKAGWSQEELAAQLNVTRQSVSKWEGAQSVPDIERILLMSRLFGVSTDYLLKDELGEPEYVAPVDEPATADCVRRVTMEQASDYLARTLSIAPKMALGVFMCVVSPVCLLMLAALSEVNRIGLTEELAAGIGVTVLLIMVAVAVAIFIASMAKVKEYEFLEKENIETEYGVRGMVKERLNANKDHNTRMIIIAVALCILSAVPILLADALSLGDFACVGAVCVLLVLVGVAAAMFTGGGMYTGAMHKLLEEEDYTREKKAKNGLIGTLSGIYWLVVTATYLICTFGPTGKAANSGNTWIIWAVGGVLYAAVIGVVELVQKRK